MPSDTPLSGAEAELLEEHPPVTAPAVYEVLRLEGEVELDRPIGSLWWSGVAAGLAISSSLLAQGVLSHHLPAEPWAPAVTAIGYTLGFIIVVLGRLQLFTENTITAVLPLLADWSRSTVAHTARLWAVVLAANFVGTFIVAFMCAFTPIVSAAHLEAMLAVSTLRADVTALEAGLRGIPAGFLIAAIVWVLPSARESTFWVVFSLTYLIAIGGFTHVVVGSAELFLLALSGAMDVGGVLAHLAPTFFGNVIGGTGLFALLAYAQVRREMDGA